MSAWLARYRAYDDAALETLANAGLLRRASKDVEAGKLPASEMETLGKMVEDISYNNAKHYFNF